MFVAIVFIANLFEVNETNPFWSHLLGLDNVKSKKENLTICICYILLEKYIIMKQINVIFVFYNDM